MGVPRSVTYVVLAALGMAGLLVSRSGVSAQAQREILAWAPMPTEPSKWIAPNRPHWKLSELLAKHKGEPNWSDSIVNDATLRAEYIAMAPGAKTARRLHPDTRAWWIVQDGQIRFTIDGQEPFVAEGIPGPGAVPQHLQHGDRRRHAVAKARGEHRRRHDDVSGRREAGVIARLRLREGSHRRQRFVRCAQQSHVDFNAVAAGTDPTRRFIADDRAVANIIRGKPQQPGPNDKGTFISSRRSSGSFSRGRFDTASARFRSFSPTRGTSCTCRSRRGISPHTVRHRCPRGWR